MTVMDCGQPGVLDTPVICSRSPLPQLAETENVTGTGADRLVPLTEALGQMAVGKGAVTKVEREGRELASQ